MGNTDCVTDQCKWCPGFRAKFSPSQEIRLQQWPKPQEADASVISEEPLKEDILIIRSIDPCIQENGTSHYTDKYDIMRREYDPQLVIRRGQPFKIILKLSRKYDPERDGISFIFTADGSKRSDPVKVTRALAAAVNSADDYGVIEGNWSNEFGGGVSPTKWIGSKEILKKFYKKKKPVKFGQCWVFSGVLTTICRALGLPTRTVTNYSSAHDTQGSLTVDYFINKEGDLLEDLNSDSVWTFHVWNEVWMCRSDVDERYDGWQVIDATPQEQSEDKYQVGPASVGAVKHGDVLKPYDNAFVFAEVNADKVYWLYTGETHPLKLLRKDTQAIGKLICTKAPGAYERLDITQIYKHPEKTQKERYTMLKALQQSRNIFARYYLNEDFNDIHFEFILKDDIKIGEAFSVQLMMTNKSKTMDYKVDVMLRVDNVDYTGSWTDVIQKRSFEVIVKANSLHEVSLEVAYNEYAKKLREQSVFKILCFANVENTNFEYYAEDDFRVRNPDIKFIIPETIIEGKECKINLYIENSLPVPLRKGEFTIEAPGFERPLKIKVKSAVPSGSKALAHFNFVPPRSGVYTLAAKFVCKEMRDCDGYQVIKVQYLSLEMNGNAE
ncbi:hypothetical protein WA026_022358 [Henosepilachna vigintioctopunctata]|uniref:Transglutaminase-like domain-containing protein n=1 Tax=Henosepilachna vigintioctopunctata TaxID=420089 RepID=A0AAW1UX72_9CUCU